MKKKLLKLTKNILYKKYIKQGMSQTKIAKEFKITRQQVAKYLIKFNLLSNKIYKRPLSKITKEFLYQEYIINNKSAIKISKELGYKSTNTIHKLLHKYKIPTNTYWPLAHILTKQYLEENYTRLEKSAYEIGEELNINPRRIFHYLKKHKIQTRPQGISNVLRAKKRIAKGLQPLKWRGYKEISGSYFGGLISGAETRGFLFEITIEDAWNLFVQQDRKCKLSGIELQFSQLRKTLCNQTASLDRIDSSKGYIEGNIQWVHKDINTIKLDYPQDIFIDYCCKISDNYRNNQEVPYFNG